MLNASSSRSLIRFATRGVAALPGQTAAPSCARFSSKAPAAAAEEEEDAISPVQQAREEMTKFDPYMVWGKKDKEFFPAPVLPEDPKEIAALDPVDQGHRTDMNGNTRTVVIRQQEKSMRQAPLNPEASWKIYFNEDGIISEKWTNSLMGWTSNADPYQADPHLTFSNAEEAVYFAKKRGWNYVVKHPITRYMRNDDAQYQDNFLPQWLAAKVQMEGTSCDYWHRRSAGTSHYYRPLKYHGDGAVKQHGPNGDADIAPAPEGYYKMR